MAVCRTSVLPAHLQVDKGRAASRVLPSHRRSIDGQPPEELQELSYCVPRCTLLLPLLRPLLLPPALAPGRGPSSTGLKPARLQ